MRALLCACVCNRHRRLKADEELVEEALDHLRQNHPTIPLGEDEQFGPEPY